MEYQIEKQVPIPTRGSSRKGRGSKYPFADMQIGDSFVEVPKKGEEPKKASLRVRGAAAGWAKRAESKFRFELRQVEEDGKVVVRCWRVADATK